MRSFQMWCFTRRQLVQVAVGGLVAATMAGSFKSASAADSSFQHPLPSTKESLCKSTVETEVRTRRSRVINALKDMGVEVSRDRESQIMGQSLDRTLATLRKAYRFTD